MKTNVKLISVTWSNEDSIDLKNSFLLKSFLKKNNIDDFINIHFNRNNYKELEEEFNSKFGYQYDYILYKIFLLSKELYKIESDNIILSDTNDVVCLKNIQDFSSNFNDKVIFGSECHRYPNVENITNWLPNFLYPVNDNNYLNSGLLYGKKNNLIKLFDDCAEHVFPMEYKNFGGDQGIFTYYYINLNKDLVGLDNSKFLLNTYNKGYNDYNDNFYFIHDNGWNFGSPKFINHFGLI
jgi:hypothetical protein